MGNFLSAPITEKSTEKGEFAGLRYGISSMQGWRANMEDEHIVENLQDPIFPEQSTFFGVFDGHGGRLAATSASEYMVQELTTEFKKDPKNNKATPEAIGEMLKRTFLSLDQKIHELPEIQFGNDQSGCTSVTAFLSKSHIIVANSGDSRAVLCKKNAVPMSFDHKPNNETERQRIEQAGGSVRNNRVNGDLAVSRALGDYVYKQRSDLPAEKQQVSCEPDIKIEPIDGKEEFLVLACDGIWDVMSNEDICEFVRTLMEEGESDMGLIAEEILDHCLELGSRDNMTASVIAFPGAKIGKGEGVAARRKIRLEKEKEEEQRKKSMEKQEEQS